MFDLLLGLFDKFGEGVWSVVGGALGWVVGTLATLIINLSAALPDNIFELPTVISSWETGLCWLNWFVPVAQLEAMLVAWVGATVAFYGARFVFDFIAKRMGG